MKVNQYVSWHIGALRRKAEYKYEKIMIEELEEFWQHVQNNEEPGMFEDKDPNLLIKH